jgi:hypothetical protein
MIRYIKLNKIFNQEAIRYRTQVKEVDLDGILHEINTIWLDPDYKLIIEQVTICLHKNI